MAANAVDDYFISVQGRPVIFDVSLNDTGDCPTLPYFTFSITGGDEVNTNGGVSRAYFNYTGGTTTAKVNWGDGNIDDLIIGINQHNYLDNLPKTITVYDIANELESLYLNQTTIVNNITTYDIQNIPLIKRFHIQSSHLTGSILPIGVKPGLEELTIGGGTNYAVNGFPEGNITGSIPSLDAYPLLKRVHFNNNKFSGLIPKMNNHLQLKIYLIANTPFLNGSFESNTVSTDNMTIVFQQCNFTQLEIEESLQNIDLLPNIGSGDYVEVRNFSGATEVTYPILALNAGAVIAKNSIISKGATFVMV